jgi:transglutaminase-like putative cysteine protease
MAPVPAVSTKSTDYFGNAVSFFTIQEPHQELTLEAQSQVEVLPDPASQTTETPAWETIASGVANSFAPEDLEACQFIFDSPQVRRSEKLAHYAAASFAAGKPLMQAVLDLTARMHRDFQYDTTATQVTTPLERFFEERRGVCQDFAHLQIACLRSIGLPARYVSGYLPTTRLASGGRLVGADASHAWVSVYSPGTGWIDVDPTNNMLPSTSHITLSWGRDYNDVSPIRGVVQGGGEHHLSVSVEVEPVAET